MYEVVHTEQIERAGNKTAAFASCYIPQSRMFLISFHHPLDVYKRQEMETLVEKYQHPILKKYGEMAKEVGGHGGMDFVMDSRLRCV